jgi:hypothetical protein
MRDYEDSPSQAREQGLRRLGRLTWRTTQIGALATVGFAIVFARTAAAPAARVQTVPTATASAPAPQALLPSGKKPRSTASVRPATSRTARPASQPSTQAAPQPTSAAPAPAPKATSLVPPTTAPKPAPSTSSPAPTATSTTHGGG